MNETPLANPKSTAERTDLALFSKGLQGKSAKDRLSAIIDRPDVMRVVRAQAVQDLFLAIKEVGPSDCLELLELLSPAQVQGFIDLDSWRGDRIDPKAMGDWLELFYEADADTAVRQLIGLDVELVTLLFKMHVKVYDLVEEEEVPGNPPISTVTPDNRYALVFDETVPKLAMALKQSVERLYGVNPRFIMGLINSLAWELPSSLEEECYRWRNGRMADLGFLPFDEALAIFSYQNPDGKITAPFRDESAALVEGATDLSNSLLLTSEVFAGVGKEGALGDALRQLPETLQEQIRHEIVLVSNRVHTATKSDPGDPGAATDTLRRVVQTLGIGLSYRARGNAAQYGDVVRDTSMRALFQVGHSVTLRLQRELRTRVRSPVSGLYGEGLMRLDAPLREVAAGVLKARPLFYAGLTDPGRVDYIHFRSLEDTAHAALALTEGAFRAALVGPKGLGLTDEVAEENGVSSVVHGPSFGVYLSTWLCRVMLALPEGFGPLSKEQFHALPEAMKRKTDAIDTLASVAAQAVPLPGADDKAAAQKRARAYAVTVLRVLEEDVNTISFEQCRSVYTDAWREEIAQVPDADSL